MKMRRWLMGAVIAATAHGAVASDDGPEPASPVKAATAAPDAGGEVKVKGAGTNSASDPLIDNYNFLLEVAGVTPGARKPPEDRTYSAEPQRHRDPRTPGKTVDGAD